MRQKRTAPKQAASKSTVNDVQRELRWVSAELSHAIAWIEALNGSIQRIVDELERSQRR